MKRIPSELLEKSLDDARLELLHLLAYQASMFQMPLYLVGGVVRDILLGRKIKEFDLVIVGDSVAFAEYVVKKFGGRIMVHPKFGTATWVINESTLKRLNFPILHLSDFSLSFDLISARSETYSSPGALPTVKLSTLDDDLRRRDFTINAMAVRLDGDHFGELVDVLDGQADLELGMIRALHPWSFIDDPTRMFRAVRYAERYGFDIEPETLALFNGEAKNVLATLSGERIRHEFDLIFEEENSQAMLRRLNDLGLLTVIHISLSFADTKRLLVIKDESEERVGEFALPEILSLRQTLGWVLYLMNLPEDVIPNIGERLAFPVLLTKAAQAASSLLKNMDKNWKPSQWVFYLDNLPALSVYAVWLAESVPQLREYLTKWKNIKPYSNGDELKRRGLVPSPQYAKILLRLRAAWLDGVVTTRDDELRLLDELLSEST